MKIPRDTAAPELIKALRCLGYAVTRQTGSHIRVTTVQNGQHHETIPNHAPIKVVLAYINLSIHLVPCKPYLLSFGLTP